MIDFQRLNTFFAQEKIFCFSSDIEWSPEEAIADLLSYFQAANIPLTPFVTHESETLRAHYSDRPSKMGLHPNFFAGSSHGNNDEAILDTVFALASEARGFRSHAFFGNSVIHKSLVERGMVWDSNLCLYLQARLTPLRHQSGTITFPVFWEDDVHWAHEKNNQLSKLELGQMLDGPGLKVLNVHPLNFHLNTPSFDYYQEHKVAYRQTGAELAKHKNEGRGTKTLVTEICEAVGRKGYQCLYLDDLYQWILDEFRLD